MIVQQAGRRPRAGNVTKKRAGAVVGGGAVLASKEPSFRLMAENYGTFDKTCEWQHL